MKSINLILLSISILLFSSCGKDTGIHITTNTFANKKIIPQGFRKGDSFSISTKQTGNKLFSNEVSKKITTLLQDRGFKSTNSLLANYNLKFSFGMEKSTHTKEVPIYIPDYGPWYYGRYYNNYRYNYMVTYVPKTYTLFNKILLIEVYKNGHPIWQGTAQSNQENSDLRDAIDYLLVTIFKHFGKNTQKNITTNIEKNNKNVIKLRTEYFQPLDSLLKK